MKEKGFLREKKSSVKEEEEVRSEDSQREKNPAPSFAYQQASVFTCQKRGGDWKKVPKFGGLDSGFKAA